MGVPRRPSVQPSASNACLIRWLYGDTTGLSGREPFRIPMTSTSTSSDGTRARLLDAALAVFAERGYHQASVRDICQRAEANSAAAHYHFGSKAQLYQAVYERGVAHIAAQTAALEAAPSVEAALAGYYRAMLAPPAGDEQAWLCARLQAREDLEPTGLLDEVRLTQLMPAHERLVAFICRQVGVMYPDVAVERLVLSLVGMGVIFLHARPLMTRLRPDLLAGMGEAEALVQQLAHQGAALVAAHRSSRQGGPK